MSETSYQRLEVLSVYDQERAMASVNKNNRVYNLDFGEIFIWKKKPCIIVHANETIERRMVKKETVFLHARIPL